jgi:hypothetical protein
MPDYQSGARVWMRSEMYGYFNQETNLGVGRSISDSLPRHGPLEPIGLTKLFTWSRSNVERSNCELEAGRSFEAEEQRARDEHDIFMVSVLMKHNLDWAVYYARRRILFWSRGAHPRFRPTERTSVFIKPLLWRPWKSLWEEPDFIIETPDFWTSGDLEQRRHSWSAFR